MEHIVGGQRLLQGQRTTLRTFRAQDARDNSWYNVPATLLASNGKAIVYGETAEAISVTTAEAVANEFADIIHPMIQANFANESDVDGNGKVILLLLDIKDGYTGSGGYVAGYFDPTHQFAKTSYANSNEADMLFLDVDPATPGSADFNGTVAHEFQHLVNFSNTYMVTGTEQDIWINEGLSSGAEFLYAGAQVQDRIDYYNTPIPSSTINTMALGNNFYVWDGYWENEGGDQLGNYSTVYLFFQWLQLHASNDTAIYKDILNSPYRDYQAVTSAASSRIDPSLSSWATTLSTWHMANLLNEPTGLRGYLGEITTTAWVLASQTDPANKFQALSSGEGVTVATGGASFNPTFTTFIYNYGITLVGVVDSAPPYVGDMVLVLNTNTNIEAADILAPLPQVSGFTPMVQRMGSQTAGPLPSSFALTPPVSIGGGLEQKPHNPRPVPKR